LAWLIWAPTMLTAIGFVAGVVSGQVRIIYEERALGAAFGEEYRAYAARTKRLIPWDF
jgi:protein-S-isoprenylcysteine O-methyltransferase Ste14